MNTIELQLEVTRFLHRCETAAVQAGAPHTKAAGSSSPPTLFSGSAVKVEVACKVESRLSPSQCGVDGAFLEVVDAILMGGCVLFIPIQVMLGGKNIEEGFGIAFRVIQVSLR